MGEGGRQVCSFKETAEMRALDHKLQSRITALMANLTAIARTRSLTLRKSETPAEIKLWQALRARRLGNYKFVRQLSIEPYFADFACRAEKLIIEVDGATHSSVAEIEYDNARTAFLEVRGWRVHRV
jgi:very-short-patch-repair endonuclease